jgi:monofunctional glycosyltransferase
MTETKGESGVRVSRPGLRHWGVRVLRWAAFGVSVLFIAPYYLTGLYIFVDPPVSAFMLRQALTGHRFEYKWRDLNRISPYLIRQVIASEDGRYCSHWGVDWSALDKAADAFADGHAKGGGSTIPMQSAKNLFLWNRPAFLRKPVELPLAMYMDFVLGKKRLMEIYLNIVEWAPGVYGAEAAAQHHFGKSALDLDPQEAAQLAAALPNPRRRDAGDPGPRTLALARKLEERAAKVSRGAACVLDGRDVEEEPSLGEWAIPGG